MRKLICYLLIVWLALVSGGASAHGASDAAHEALHAAHTHQLSSHTPASADNEQLQADHANACNQSQCGHGHCAGLLMPPGAPPKVADAASVPLSRGCWASAAIVNNIERPKWPFTTPAVVSLLS